MNKCEICKFGSSKEYCVLDCNKYNKFSPITNLEYLFRNKNKLASLLIEIYDNPNTKYMEFCTMDGRSYSSFEEASSHQLEWLNENIDLDVYF